MKKNIKNVVLIYLISWVLGFVLLLWQLVARGEGFVESVQRYFEDVLPNKSFLVAQHLLFLILLVLFLLVRYFRKVYRKYGSKLMFKRLGLYLLLPVTLLVVSFKTLVHLNTSEVIDFTWDEKAMNQSGEVANYYERDGLHRGMSVFGWQQDNTEGIDALVKANVEWVAVVPFIWQENEQSPEVASKREDGIFTRRDSTFIKAINDLHQKGIHVHLKPHLWLGEGWRSNLNYSSKEDWDTWFNSYRSRMLHYAKMAQLTKAELFCVGTELRTSIKKQPEAWKLLIADIRDIYDGPLTYAANWYDEYEHIGFWDALDYIGIQAYFPLTKVENPDLESIKTGWQPHIETLAALSKTEGKPILFTEVGYKSEASATIKPWEWDDTFGVLYKKKSDQTQQLAFEALFQELWDEEWFAGVYIWEWNTRSQESNAPTNLNFSPRFKPAENVIAKWFGQPKVQ
ncbi:glycoside hydrolase family 113 [Croceivirga thetidis]|uniref:Glycoside hydrolase n=1 Tax=Croceivirga thetidis TaxID=2721623 RepID=A0ABX1GM10_9FLAO|nr:hypothetical protein [Croceivirga thetidis]NKI30928.1 hypothetical protein [Croceivirga thetidis]